MEMLKENDVFYTIYTEAGQVLGDFSTREEAINHVKNDCDVEFYDVIITEKVRKGADNRKYWITTILLIDTDTNKGEEFVIECNKIRHGEVVRMRYEEEYSYLYWRESEEGEE